MKLVKALAVGLVVSMAMMASAQTWKLAASITNVMQNSATGEMLASVFCSADGKKVAAIDFHSNPDSYDHSPLILSTNSGDAWFPRFTAADVFDPTFGYSDWAGWQFGVSSADGNRIFILPQSGSPLLLSTNSGTDWSKIYLSGDGLSGPSVCSADGKILLAVDANQTLSVSTNFGDSWTSGTNVEVWTAVGLSADGNNMVAACLGKQNGIYVSTNCGASWSSEVCPDWSWKSVTSSADGHKLAAAAIAPYGGIVISTNGGTTWQVTSAPNTNWVSIASSADGTTLVGAVSGGQLYVSTDSGGSWSESSLPACTNWNQVVCSADGGILIAASTDGKIYTLRSIPQPLLSVSPGSNSLTLAWTIPSTNFVVQQSADLVSWTDMTNMPQLNFANLQDEVRLPASTDNGFYRLKTP